MIFPVMFAVVLALTLGQTAAPQSTVATAWGDSLTCGNQDHSGGRACGAPSTGDYASFLEAIDSGIKVQNEGIPGQTTHQICVRMNCHAGGTQQQASVAGGIIPVSGSVGITFTPLYEPAYNSWITNKNCVAIIISGVKGCATYNGSPTYKFTRSQSGPAVSSPAQSQWLADTDGLLAGPQLIEGGFNSVFAVGGGVSGIEADIAAMVQVATKNRLPYLVIATPNGELYSPGTQGYQILQEVNTDLERIYGAEFLDINAGFRAAYNPQNAIDVLDVNNGISPPYTLRAVDMSGAFTADVTADDCLTNPLPVKMTSSAAVSLQQGGILTIGSELLFVKTTKSNFPVDNTGLLIASSLSLVF